ncbi:HD domain-containing protein [Oceanobacillus piezotolerans]|uniref:HD domain-containing protein n=1 Tax=Oceanobacillus piezotolerans TaxID=2448030 RepID=A0A498DIB8_9BACI|nr:HD domain-containing protein [Oceanobacillus piezotolerans]RLL48289.1 HD domain-containing protein [Oceanobacillus piezotolerans]
MILSDKLYGEFEIEKVLEDLLGCKAVQRLKGVHQGGASYLVNEKWNVTRFDHSIGVMLLIRKLGGSIEEQIAGLLHDVSHTAFSHVVDFVFDNSKEDYHEGLYRSVIEKSEIPAILEKYGYDFEELLFNNSTWTILEQDAPELCADRVDYTLRDRYEYGDIPLVEVHRFLSDIMIVDGKICLQSIDLAEWFVETYYKEVIDFFMDPLNIYGNDRLSKTLKLAMNKGHIGFDDFLKMDHELILKLQDTNDDEIIKQLKSINQHVYVKEDRNEYDIYRKNKIRIINPTVACKTKLVKASKISEKVDEMNREAYEKAINGMYVKIISN